jgi:1-acyl-sn-glycerol-3-phosphate acyltransferase
VKQTFETRAAAVRRRLVTVPRLFLGLAVLTVLAPVAIPVALVVDSYRWLRARIPFMAVRLYTFGWVYFALSALGVLGFFVTWIAAGFGRNERLLLRSAYAIQRWWGSWMFGAASFALGLDTTVTGQEALAGRPCVLLFRHASIVDNLLPLVFVMGDPYRIKLRWLIKRELLAEPALDIGGKRLPNYFVDRRGRSADEVAAIKKLAEGMGSDGGIMIFPEGTRFTPEKRLRALRRLDKDPDSQARADKLQHTLPPRPAGTFAALEGAPDADVVIAAHVGLDGLSSLGDIWNGSITGRHIHLDFRRVPRSAVPEDRRQRTEWLMSEWQRVDDWIGEHL